ncbi:hypothetical protein FA15DRAFT_711928 [Coprinopsis marcescibilis]|uniref:Uncharacterized protein n=1 Tax=Coprinopsis marcescibilis TaxID=230819 RepID=A0A5C3K900_COPMA|nr:hypothetical protein FA15DRAFT_711928 [Coprinopsis marcescibilis]
MAPQQPFCTHPTLNPVIYPAPTLLCTLSSTLHPPYSAPCHPPCTHPTLHPAIPSALTLPCTLESTLH